MKAGTGPKLLPPPGAQGRCRGRGGSANHAFGMETSSDARRHTSEMNNKAGEVERRGARRKWVISLGRAGAETDVNILRNGSKRVLG